MEYRIKSGGIPQDGGINGGINGGIKPSDKKVLSKRFFVTHIKNYEIIRRISAWVKTMHTILIVQRKT